MRRPPWQIGLALAATLGGLAGCSSPAPTPAGLTLFVAASLGPTMDAVAAAYASENPDLTITQSNGSSTALRVQIEQGAPADLFLSADTANAQRLADAGRVVGSPVVFAANGLAIVVPSDNPAGLRTAADLGRDGVRIVAAGEEVPITAYAATVLADLAALPDVPDDLPALYAANVVSREEDVRAALAKVELGEADAAIVYATDAAGSTEVETIAIPESAQVRAEYSGAVITGAAHEQQASAFLAWLRGPDGQALLSERGFLPP